MGKPLKRAIQKVDLSLIDEPSGRIRIEIDPALINELAESISQVGLLQPIVLRSGNGRYEIIAGHRRYLAHKVLNESVIDAVVVVLSDIDAAVARATENLARVDLSPLEEAAIWKDLTETHGMSFEEIGKKFGRNPATIRRRIDLLKMPPVLQKAVHDRKISHSVAEELWCITDPTSLDYYLMFAVENGCTKQVANAWAKEWKDSVRRSQEPGAVGGGVTSPSQPRPYYIACDICHSPAELGKESVLRICDVCSATIKQNM